MFVFLISLVMLVFALSPASMGLSILAENLTQADPAYMQLAYDRNRP